MNPYIYLGGAILAEVIGTTLMKFSEGFTRLWPSVGTIICYCASFWLLAQTLAYIGFAPIFPDTCYHLTHYWPAAADIPVASDNPVHYAGAIRYNARTPLQGSLLPLTRLV